MPTCKATYKTFSETGENASDRPTGDKAAPSVNIEMYAKPLADFMSKLDGGGRSAYACAEAQALAKLLGQVGETIDFAQIVLSRATSDGGVNLWAPCANCAQWLTESGGWGPDKKFKLAQNVLSVLAPKKKETGTPPPSRGTAGYKEAFPSLSGGK